MDISRSHQASNLVKTNETEERISTSPSTKLASHSRVNSSSSSSSDSGFSTSTMDSDDVPCLSLNPCLSPGPWEENSDSDSDAKPGMSLDYKAFEDYDNERAYVRREYERRAKRDADQARREFNPHNKRQYTCIRVAPTRTTAQISEPQATEAIILVGNARGTKSQTRLSNTLHAQNFICGKPHDTQLLVDIALRQTMKNQIRWEIETHGMTLERMLCFDRWEPAPPTVKILQATRALIAQGHVPLALKEESSEKIRPGLRCRHSTSSAPRSDMTSLPLLSEQRVVEICRCSTSSASGSSQASRKPKLLKQAESSLPLETPKKEKSCKQPETTQRLKSSKTSTTTAGFVRRSDQTDPRTSQMSEAYGKFEDYDNEREEENVQYVYHMDAGSETLLDFLLSVFRGRLS